MFFSRIYFQSSVSQKCSSLIPRLELILGKGSVNVSEVIRDQHSHDECHHKSKLPDIVTFPKNVEEVSAIVKLCNENKVPIIPFGTGTGLEGGVVPIYNGITVDLKEMNKILQINPDDFDCFVEAGVTRKRLNETIRDSGLFFCVDPGTDASIGGMIATCASGTTSLRYGTMKTNVKNLEVVLADGSILNTRGKFGHPSKSSAGFNLTELFVGQEGVLGIITSACLKLHLRPTHVSAAVCGFNDIKDAINAVINIRKIGISIARIEFLDSEQIKACNEFNKEVNEMQFEEKPTLILEFHGSSERDIEEQSIATEEICLFNHGQQFKWSKSKTDIHNLWAARHNAFYAIVNSKAGKKGFSTDICVPITKIYNVILETQKDLKELGLHSPILGPIAEGGFHCFFSVDPENAKEMKRIYEFSDRLAKRAAEAGGTCSGEHGIGIGKKKYLKDEMGPIGFKLIQTLKRTLDPKNIMNPGKVVDFE